MCFQSFLIRLSGTPFESNRMRFQEFRRPKGPRRDSICQTRLERPGRMRRYPLLNIHGRDK